MLSKTVNSKLEKKNFSGNSNILSQHLQNLNLHQTPLVNVPQTQGKNFQYLHYLECLNFQEKNI